MHNPALGIFSDGELIHALTSRSSFVGLVVWHEGDEGHISTPLFSGVNTIAMLSEALEMAKRNAGHEAPPNQPGMN